MGKIVSNNKKANFEYFLSDNLEVGMKLLGPEVKGTLENGINLKESHARIINNEVFLMNANINCITPAWDKNDISMRPKKLLLHKKQINKFQKLLKNPGTTLIVSKVYIAENGLLKAELCLAKGKKLYDKRNVIKERDISRSEY